MSNIPKILKIRVFSGSLCVGLCTCVLALTRYNSQPSDVPALFGKSDDLVAYLFIT